VKKVVAIVQGVKELRCQGLAYYVVNNVARVSHNFLFP
jgi:hypothetical protein